jgi:hypothetical protein
MNPLTTTGEPYVAVIQCEHRGDAIRREGCESCGNGIAIKVFACSKHGECQIGDKLPNVKQCDHAVS